MVAIRGVSLLWAIGVVMMPTVLTNEVEHQPSLRGIKERSEVQPEEPSEDQSEDAGEEEPSEEEPSEEEHQRHKSGILCQTQAQKEAAKQASVVRQVVVISTLIIQVVLTTIVGLLYNKCCQCKPSPEEVLRQDTGPEEGFRYGLCEGCCHSCRICCCSFWCLPIRWADTASSPNVKFLGFSAALFFFELLFVLSFIPRIFIVSLDPDKPVYILIWAAVTLLVQLVLVSMLVVSRQHIRRQYGLRHSTCSTRTCDCLTWWFCGPCAAMQEALQVEYVGEPVEIKGSNDFKSENGDTTI